MSSSSAARDSLGDIPPGQGLTEIYTGASECLDIINLWSKASTNNAKFQEVINKVQDHSVIYFDALNTSITTATDGLMLSIEIIDTCLFLLRKDIDPEDLKESLSDIKDKAQKAHSDSKRTLEKFQDVRENLNKIITSLPKKPTDEETWKVVNFFSRHLPFGRDVKYEEAIEESRPLVDSLASLSETIDKFYEWWGIIEKGLAQAKKKAVDLKMWNRATSVQVEEVKTTWKQVRDDYQQYRDQMTSSSSTTVLDSLVDIPPCKGLTEIYTGASKCLDFINLWKQASTDNAKFQKVINKVQDHSVIYFRALDTSITTATEGLKLSIEIIDICPFLLRKDIDPEDLKESLSEIRGKAKKAHKDSKRTLEEFRHVREDLFKITKSLPKDSTDEETSKVVKFSSKHLPFVGRDVKYKEAIEELQSLVDTLASLSENVDKFCEWWDIIQVKLTTAKDKADDLKSSKVNSVKVEQMKTTWERIRDDYQQYRNQIMKLQDHYPSRIEEAGRGAGDGASNDD